MSHFSTFEFELFAANLRAVFDPRHSEEPLTVTPTFDHARLGEIVLCPLCLKAFDRADLTAKILTVEHIVPSGGGGANLTLTCKCCNNRTGSKLDSQLLKRIEHEANFHENGGPTRIQLTLGEGQQNAQLYIKRDEEGEDFFEVVGLPGQSNPILQTKLIEELRNPTSSNQELKIDFSLGFVEVLNKTALLRSAYLMMFRFFGYSYILHPTLDAVRRQIWEPTCGKGAEAYVTAPLLLDGIWSSETAAQWGASQVCWAQTTGVGFVVSLFLSTRSPSGSLVPMLKPGETDADFRARLMAPKPDSDSESGRFQLKIFDRVPDLLIDPQSCHFVRKFCANWGGTSL